MGNSELLKKVMIEADELLKCKGYIAFVDLFIKLKYLDEKDYENWRMRKVPYLEKAIKINLDKISFIMKHVRKNCINGKLKPSFTGYSSWGKGSKIKLRFSKSGEESIENTYSTHYLQIQEN